MQTLFDTDLNPNDKSYYKQNSNSRNYGYKKTNSKSNFPKMIGYFSVNEHREFMPNASQLKYVKMPVDCNVHFDLNKGIEDFQPKPPSVKQEKMDFLLRFILNNVEKLKVKTDYGGHNKLLDADVICSRGRLAQIMCINEYNVNKWSLLVSKYKGNIYICQPDGDDSHTIQTAYGFKFEQYMMTEHPSDDPITDVPVIESEEFYSVFESEVGNISLLYNAEMDGLDSHVKVELSKNNFDELKFVEIKTIMNSSYVNVQRSCKWWAQSVLAGVSKIIVGCRDRSGIVNRVDSIDVQDLVDRQKENWSPEHCSAFLKAFLSFLKLALRHVNCPYTVYKFDYDPNKSKYIQYAIFQGRNEYSFLRDWYINEMSIQKY